VSESKTHIRNGYAWCEDEIVRKIVLPKLQAVFLKYGNDLTSKQDLLRRMREEHGDQISASFLNRWLEMLDIKFTRKLVIEGAGPAPTDSTDRPERPKRPAMVPGVGGIEGAPGT
jgi:hypothetical protein